MMRTRHKRITAAILLILLGMAVLVISYVRRPIILYEIEYLPSLDGFPTAHSINDLGQVVMSRVILSPAAAIQTQIYIWDSKKVQVDYGPFTKGFVSDLRMNNAGQICGMLGHPNACQQPFFWDPNDGLLTFGALSKKDARGKTDTRIGGMNNTGQVIGYGRAQIGQRISQAFIWDSKTGMIDLGSLGGGGTDPSSINDAGQVVGFSNSVSPTLRRQAFLWDKDGGMSGIEGIGPTSIHINNNGLLVGITFGRHGRVIELVGWRKDTGCKTLATFTGYSGNVKSINDEGQILLVIRRKGFRILNYVFCNRTEYWLWDTRRGKIQLAKQLRRSGGRFRPVDMNNKGWILGCVYDEKTNRPLQWLLLKPIEEKWK
jgi:probable HAF family extracellular repeat protein